MLFNRVMELNKNKNLRLRLGRGKPRPFYGRYVSRGIEIKVIVSILALLLSQPALAKAGPEIPAPNLTYIEAHNSAKKELLSSKHNVDPSYAPAEEYLLGSISYDKKGGSWVWVVEFFHPRANDHTVIYHVTQSGSVVFSGATE